MDRARRVIPILRKIDQCNTDLASIGRDKGLSCLVDETDFDAARGRTRYLKTGSRHAESDDNAAGVVESTLALAECPQFDVLGSPVIGPLEIIDFLQVVDLADEIIRRGAGLQDLGTD